MPIGAIGLDGDLALGERQHAQAARRESVLLGEQRFAIDRTRRTGAVHAVSHGNQGLRRTLDEHAHPIPAVMKRGGVFQVGLVGDAGDQGMRASKVLVHKAALMRGSEQSDVNGVSGGFPAVLAATEPRLVR